MGLGRSLRERISERSLCTTPTSLTMCGAFAMADLVHVAVGKDDHPVSIGVQRAEWEHALSDDLFRHHWSESGKSRTEVWSGVHVR